MSAPDVRLAWLQARDEAIARAGANKQGQETLAALSLMYRALSADDRHQVDQLLAEQLSSQDETERFDAIALIGEFSIGSALPALRRLADWLETGTWPGAPYEWAKVNRLVGRMADPSEQRG